MNSHKTHGRWIFLCFSMALIAGCQAPSEQGSQVQVECSSPRPEVCTFEYKPVCGLDESGQWSTHGNGCTACSNENVIGYNPGACDDAEGEQ